jgi:hypothetical protein
MKITIEEKDKQVKKDSDEFLDYLDKAEAEINEISAWNSLYLLPSYSDAYGGEKDLT